MRGGAEPAGRTPWSRRDLLVLAACTLLAAVVLELRLGAWAFYEDEGINLMKAAMVGGGHTLYRDVYSDQAPLFTWLLVPVGQLLGWQYQPMRQVAVLFGVLLLAGAGAVARQVGGRAAALVTVVLLLALAPVQKFAATLVIATPALAFSVWSLFVALVSAARGSARIAAGSGVLLALACATKASFLYFVPAVLVALLWTSEAGGRGRRGAAWAAGLLIPCLLVLAVSAGPLASQVTTVHVAAREVFAQQAAAARRFMLLAPGFPFLYAAALMGGLVFLRRLPEVRPVALWLGTVLAWMLVHRPLWSHHLPELLVPLVILVSAAVVQAATTARVALVGRRFGPLEGAAAACLVLVGVGLVSHVTGYARWRRYYNNTPVSTLARVGGAVASRTGPGDWVIVDRPMVAFLAQRQVPPPLAMMSRKRIAAGDLEPDLMAALDRYRPALVALCTDGFERFAGFRSALARSYRQVQVLTLPTEFTSRTRECRLLARADPS